MHNEVVSAVELTAEEKNKINELFAKLFGKDLKPEFRVDPAILGGLLLKHGDSMINVSLKSKLQEIENTLLK